MSVTSTSEEAIINNAKKFTPHNETSLVGVYAVRIGAVPWKFNMMNTTFLGSAISSLESAEKNKGLEIFVNDIRIIIGEHGLLDNNLHQITMFFHKDIQNIKVGKGFTYKVKMTLADGNKYMFRIGYFVFGHKTHKQRAAQVISRLKNF